MCKLYNFSIKKPSQIKNCHSLIKYKAYKWKSTRKMTVDKISRKNIVKNSITSIKHHDEEKINEH